MRKKLKPAEGRDVPMEDGSNWPAEGTTVEVTHYIRRRLAAGDLIEAEAEGEIESSRKAKSGGK